MRRVLAALEVGEKRVRVIEGDGVVGRVVRRDGHVVAIGCGDGIGAVGDLDLVPGGGAGVIL